MPDIAIKMLQEAVDKRLGLDNMLDSRRFQGAGGPPSARRRKIADKILCSFDRDNKARLLGDSRRMSTGAGVVSDVQVPSIYERTVLREALYRTAALDWVDADEERFGPSITIPFSYRDTTAAGRDSTRVYEGGEIPRAGVIQAAELAYPIPQKLAFSLSDELRYLASTQALSWDAVAENALNTSRIIAEDVDFLLYRELIMASDEYGAVAVTDEDLELQADGAKTVFVTAQFPIVRPRRVYDLQGNQLGSTSNPVVVSYNSVALSEFDGTGTQAAGTYYVLDYNLGEIYLVDESGAVQIPANGTAYTISYSYATNVYKFDTDLGSNDPDVHWDNALYRIAIRKGVIEDQRYYTANLGLMSGNAMGLITQAKQFGANSKRAGTDLDLTGDLGTIKGVPFWKTAGPGNPFGDLRILIGQKGITRFRLLKTWELEALESERGPNGRFTGRKTAYGSQFVCVHTPTPLKAAYTTLLLYSATARVAR